MYYNPTVFFLFKLTFLLLLFLFSGSISIANGKIWKNIYPHIYPQVITTILQTVSYPYSVRYSRKIEILFHLLLNHFSIFLCPFFVFVPFPFFLLLCIFEIKTGKILNRLKTVLPRYFQTRPENSFIRLMALLLLSPLKRYRFINDLTKAPVTSDFFFPPAVKFANFEPRAHAYIRACKHRGKRSRERIGSETTFSHANWHPLEYTFLRIERTCAT